MSVDGHRGKVEFFEDFIGLDVVADRSEYAVDTDPAVEVVSGAGGEGGVVRITMDAGQSNVGGIGFGQLQWSAHDNYLYMEARVKMSAIGAAAERFFVGFTDAQEDTLTEMPFTGATTVTTAVADPEDAVGWFFEGDFTTAAWYPASQNTDSLVVHGSANMTAAQKIATTPVAATWHTLAFRIDSEAKYTEFYFDGELVYTYSGTTAVVADVPLIPIIVVTEGTSAVNFDIDYVYVEMGRDN